MEAKSQGKVSCKIIALVSVLNLLHIVVNCDIFCNNMIFRVDETSKKGTLFPLVGYCKYQRKKMFAAKEEVKESFGVRKEESTSCMDGSPEASKHEKTEASSHSNDTSEYATNIHTLFSKLKSTITSASPVVSGAFAKLKDTNLPKQGYGVVKDELSSSSSRKKEKKTPILTPTKKTVLGEKWEAFKKKIRGHPVYKRVDEYTKPVVTKGQEMYLVKPSFLLQVICAVTHYHAKAGTHVSIIKKN
ncbi:hypothetical protein ACJX0J_032871 [Zea mays]